MGIDKTLDYGGICVSYIERRNLQIEELQGWQDTFSRQISTWSPCGNSSHSYTNN